MSPQDLARSLSSLRYDALVDYLFELSDALEDDALADKNRGREKLFDALYAAAHRLKRVAEDVNDAWKICEPHMIDEEKK